MTKTEYKSTIKNEVEKNIQQAEQLFGRDFERLPISFNLKGKTAGMYKSTSYGNMKKGVNFRFNLDMVELNGWEKFKDTIPHEVAHHITSTIYPSAKPHGREWKGVMMALGYNPSRTHEMKAVKNNNKKEYVYECDCGLDHTLSATLHNRVQKGVFKGRKYTRSCKKCKAEIRFVRET